MTTLTASDDDDTIYTYIYDIFSNNGKPMTKEALVEVLKVFGDQQGLAALE